MEVQIPQSKAANVVEWSGTILRIGRYGIGRAKTAEPIELPFELVNRFGPKNRVLGGRAHLRHLANTIKRLCAEAMSAGLPLGVATQPLPRLL